jgi:hypothetical protein
MELALSGLCSANFAKLILRATPTPQKTFFTNAPLHIVAQRRPDFTEENIRAKQNIYRKFAKIFNFEMIETYFPFEANQEHVQKEVLFLLKENR